MTNKAPTKCPNCGGPLVKPEDIGLPKSYGVLYCSMNMPYQGCGWGWKPKV